MRYVCGVALAAAFVSFAVGQQTAPPGAKSAPSSPATGSPGATPGEHPGTVIFSRSSNDGGSETAPERVTPPVTTGVTVTDAERRAITFLSYDLDIHLRPSEHAMAVRTHMVLRNDSTAPLDRLALQISSTLQWTAVRVGRAPAAFSQQAVDSDMDHTGTLREAVIPLAQPLAPQQTLTVDATYEGTAPLTARRLEHIGTPGDVGEASDWDRVSDEFVGLRGFGNVVWYPVSSVPVALGDGDKFFTEAAAQRQRQSQAMVSMRVTEEFFGQAPNLAVLNGETFPVTPASLPTAAGVPGIATCALPPTRLGFASPSLFLLTRTAHTGDGVTVFARSEDGENAQAFMQAASLVTPLIQHWMGTQPHGTLSIVDLPEEEDAPFEDGTVLFADVQSAQPEKLAAVLIHSLTHMYFRSPYEWLQEGVPSFMGSLWLEQNHGRDAAIQQLDHNRGALSLVEPADTAPDPAATQPLLTARDPVYYRTKATYVFWMLRDLAGDDALSRALRVYQGGSDLAGTEFEAVLERTSGKDLKWFFDDWVYQDRGLPDLSIANVYPAKATVPGSYIVSVEIANSGTAQAQVPVSVYSDTSTVTERVRIPAKSRISHRFLLSGRPAEVVVNDGTVPEVEASAHRETITLKAASE